MAGRGAVTVVLCFDTLGDLLLRQPLLRGLLDRGRRVAVVARRGYDTLVPFLDPRLHVLAADVDPNRLPGAETAEGLEGLRRAIDALGPGTLVSAPCERTWVDEWLLERFPDIPRAGFATPPGPFVVEALGALGVAAGRPSLTLGVECPPEQPEPEKNHALLEALCGEPLPREDPRLDLPDDVTRDAADALAAMGLEPRRYAVGCLGGRTPLKTWPLDSYARLLGSLQRRHDLPLLLVGTAPEASLLEAARREATAAGGRVVTWVGGATEIGRLLGLVARSRLYVGADTGPMHFAAALGVPVLARFGGGHWPRFLPLARRIFVATQELPCFGCGWQCWVGEAACVTRVRHEVLEEGLAWILGDRPDERRQDTGERLAPLAALVVEGAHRVAEARLAEGGVAIAALTAESAERARAIETLAAESAERGRVIDRMAADVRDAIRTLEEVEPRHPLGWLLPQRLYRTARAVTRARVRLRALVG